MSERAGEPSHGAGKGSADLRLRSMRPIADNPFTADHDIANGGRVSREQPRVNQGVAGAANQRRVLGVQDDQICVVARFDRTAATAERLGATR